MIDNDLIAFHAFASHILRLLSVDEIYLPRYKNLFSNFRGLQLRVNMAPPRLKHLHCFIYFHVDVNDACSLQYAMQLGFELGKKRCVV